MEVKWGLHPISAEAPRDETIGEASFRQSGSAAGASAKKSRSGSSAGALEGAPRFCFVGAILSEVMASGADLIRNVKQQIEEIDPKDVQELRQNGGGNGTVIVD